MYAQTNIQLFNQLQHEGYSKAEVSLIRDAYELAMVLFSGRFLPSGKTLISHFVCTASILASLRLPVQVVAAGLIHNVYGNGDFGDGSTGISKTKREEVRRAVGNEVEGYVARFATLRWTLQTIRAIRDGLNELDPIDRDVVLIHLADHLENLLDLGVLYRGDLGRRLLLDNGPIVMEMAEKLGFSTLAGELEQALSEATLAEIPVELATKGQNRSRVIAPRSYRRRPAVAFRQELSRVKKQLGQLVRRASHRLLP